jgi:hypothetical protein
MSYIMGFPSYINNKYTNKLLEKYSVFQCKEYHFSRNTHERYVGFVVRNYEEYLEINDVLFECLIHNK